MIIFKNLPIMNKIIDLQLHEYYKEKIIVEVNYIILILSQSSIYFIYKQRLKC